MYILGISYGIGSGAALLKDGRVIAAAQEERFSRHKFDKSFPKQSILSCLGGMDISEIDAIGVVGKAVDVRRELKHEGKVVEVNPLLSHASIYFCSGFEKAAVLVVDSAGIAMGFGKHRVNLLDEREDSVCWLYKAVTRKIGFGDHDEYKVMGLAAYAKPLKLLSKVQKLADLNKVQGTMKELASSIQAITEERVFALLDELYDKTRVKELVLSGSMALNSVLNDKIIRKTAFKKIWIQPNPTGGCVGAALHVWHDLLGKDERHKLEHAYLGPEFDSIAIVNALKDSGLKYRKMNQAEVAEMLNSGKVIGWFQGRMEWGPRALGNRSILASPGSKDMKDLLNEKVKHREGFRPFSPSVCNDDANKYFECDVPLPVPAEFMLMVYSVRKEWRERLTAVTHVDGSARVQVVHKEHNPRFYSLLKEFGKVSGVPVLLNTSFNDKDEPIVCNPEDALSCFKRTEIDVIVIGDYLIEK